MEARTHCRLTYAEGGKISWIEQDFLSCSGNFKSSFNDQPSSIAHPSPLSETSQRPRVGIVGAGLAGLRCAEVLINEGVEVTILEARNRIGGRVHQMDLLSRAVDMGPSWIHGTFTNPVLRLAEETETAHCLIEDNAHIFDTDGSSVCPDRAIRLFDLVWNIISDAFKYSNENCRKISPKRSLKDFFMERLPEYGLEEDDRRLVLQIAEVWGAFIGDPWDNQSLKYFWLEECLDGENLFVAGTHRAILQRIAQKALSNAKILLDTEVTSIRSFGNAEAHSKVLVKTANREFEFDDVVITVPLGCLKKGTPNFYPPLPSSIFRAIQNASYGHLEKIYITFPKAFWDSTVLEPKITTPGKEIRFPSFSHFLCPTYSIENTGSWTLELVSLSSPELFGCHSQPTLLFCVHGPYATHITSLITPLSSSSPEYFKVIDDFFRPYYALLPNYDGADRNCIPEAVLATNWQNDRLAGYGSYINFQIRDELREGEPEVKLEEDIRALRRGMPERGIWLAGEHTAPFVALGTSTGAYWSGESVGVRILRAYGLVTGKRDKNANDQ